MTAYTHDPLGAIKNKGKKMIFAFEIKNILIGSSLSLGLKANLWNNHELMKVGEERKLRLDETELKANIGILEKCLENDQISITLLKDLNYEEKIFLNDWSPDLFKYLKLNLEDINNKSNQIVQKDIIQSINEIEDRFEFIKIIGGGGYADVWEAKDKKLDRTVAIKIIRSSSVLVSNKDKEEKALSNIVINHAKLLAKVNHPNVVTIYETSKITDPENHKIMDAIIMEFLNGKNLFAKLEYVLTLKEAELIGNSIIDGIEAIHNQGIFHNDFHTGNIIICEDKVKIIDLYHDETTFALFSTISLDQGILRDINCLKHNLTDILNKTNEISLEKIDIFRKNIREEKKIFKIKEVFNACFILNSNENNIKIEKIQNNEDLERIKKLDLKTYIKFKDLLPYEKSIRFIKENNFGGSFNWNDLEDLNKFTFECEKPEFEFSDHELEEMKLSLRETINKFTHFLGANTFQIGSTQRYVIYPKLHDKPREFNQILNKLNELSLKIFEDYSKLIKKGRFKLEE